MLEGKRINLRPLLVSDLSARLEMVNSPEVQLGHLGTIIEPTTIDELEAWFYQIQNDPFSELWAITTPEGLYIGDVDLYDMHVISGEAWISPMVGHPAYLNDSALLLEAIYLMAQYVFNEKQVNKLLIDQPITDRHELQILSVLGFQPCDGHGEDLFTDVQTLTLFLEPQSLMKPS